MSKQEKLYIRLLSRPKDFTFKELVSLLSNEGYHLVNSGKTSGSRVEFVHQFRGSIKMHKPHSRNYLLDYEVKNIIEKLEDNHEQK